MEYKEFLATKRRVVKPSGFKVGLSEINPKLFDFQRAVTRWCLLKGKSAVFAGCGLGKTAIQLEWAKQVYEHTFGNVLILAPLMVAKQTAFEEATKFGVDVNFCRKQDDVKPGINITNYEMLENFDADKIDGIALDESSILKSLDGKTRNLIIDMFVRTLYKLCCSATPNPNDQPEIGNHAEFLGVCTYQEMLAEFFVHDGGDTSKWRLKGHAVKDFWKWVASWACMFQKPSDIGFSDEGYNLPPLKYHHIIVNKDKLVDYQIVNQAVTLKDQLESKKKTIDSKIEAVKGLVEESDDFWAVFCNLNQESEALRREINGLIELTGSQSPEVKEQLLDDFISGRSKKLGTKAKIAGFGLNLQFCHNVILFGLGHSFEAFFQLVRRFWRFGQTEEVNVYIVTCEEDGPIVANIKRKERDFETMMREVISITQDITKENIQGTHSETNEYKENTASGKNWTVKLGDSVELIKNIDDNSIHYSIFSPPFASLYTYSNSERDMGNCHGEDEFLDHFKFLVKELYRVIMPGRLLSFHCMNLPTTKSFHGYIGIQDFRGNLIKMFQEEGFIYHSEVCIWKDPVVAMQRTKALGLLYKQIQKDSAMCRQGIPDYLVTMRKPGENTERISHTKSEFPCDIWQKYASPVWSDINPSDTLQRTSARDNADERHICPLQLTVIKRGMDLWTNPCDIVLDPFGGIGSTGDVAIRMGRKALLIELKESYYGQAVKNCRAAEMAGRQLSLFDEVSYDQRVINNSQEFNGIVISTDDNLGERIESVE